MTVSVSVVRGKSIQSSRMLSGASDGKVVRTEAIAEGQYLLTEQDTGVGPENITVKRVGSDLHVALQGTEPDQPELINEGFFDLPGQLIGLAEDGAYYGYIAVGGEADHEAAFLLEEMSSPWALGYPSVVGFGDGLVAAASVLPGALLGMGHWQGDRLSITTATVAVGFRKYRCPPTTDLDLWLMIKGRSLVFWPAATLPTMPGRHSLVVGSVLARKL